MPEIIKPGDASAFKPKSALDVTYANETLENDTWANKALRDIGKSIYKEEGLKYSGSMAVHFYVGDVDRLQVKVTFGSIEQLCLDNTAQNIVQIGWQNLGIALAKAFGHKHRTRNTKDKR